MNLCVPLVTTLHDDSDASIKEGVKDSHCISQLSPNGDIRLVLVWFGFMAHQPLLVI